MTDAIYVGSVGFSDTPRKCAVIFLIPMHISAISREIPGSFQKKARPSPIWC